MRLFDMDSREDYLLDGKYKVATPYAPLVDVVEVVRCKDCIHWFPHTQCGFDEDNGEYHDYCGLLIPDDDYYAYTRNPDDYCSYGKQRGDIPMTREEAIEILKQYSLYSPTSQIEDALDMAIEALSAEAVQEWIPFKKRPLTDEEKQEYPDWTYIFDCPLPDDEEEILLSNGKYVWTDTFINDGECYLDGGDDIDEGMAWMPLPKPYKGGAE